MQSCINVVPSNDKNNQTCFQHWFPQEPLLVFDFRSLLQATPAFLCMHLKTGSNVILIDSFCWERARMAWISSRLCFFDLEPSAKIEASTPVVGGGGSMYLCICRNIGGSSFLVEHAHRLSTHTERQRTSNREKPSRSDPVL